MEALAGRSGASHGLALAWHREGGIAGFCDDLSVYVTSDIRAATCRAEPPENVGHGWLTEHQAVRLFIWVDGLQPFEWSHTDPATADAMTMRIVFSGAGKGEAGEAEIQAIGFFAAEQFAELQQSAGAGPPSPHPPPQERTAMRPLAMARARLIWPDLTGITTTSSASIAFAL